MYEYVTIQPESAGISLKYEGAVVYLFGTRLNKINRINLNCIY